MLNSKASPHSWMCSLIRWNNRMWGKAFRGDDGSQVRRKRPVRPCGLTSKGLSLCLFELNYRIRGRTLRDESLETNTARDLKQVVRMFVEMDVGPVSPSSTSQDARHRAQKWNVGLERRKERETFCGRLRKRTPFLRWRAQLNRIRGKALWNESLETNTAKDSERVVWMFVEVDVVSAFSSSTPDVRHPT